MSVVDEIRHMVSLQLGVREVALEDDLLRELGAESADIANLAARLEERYDLEIAEEELADLRTVGDLVRCVERDFQEKP